MPTGTGQQCVSVKWMGWVGPGASCSTPALSEGGSGTPFQLMVASNMDLVELDLRCQKPGF